MVSIEQVIKKFDSLTLEEYNDIYTPTIKYKIDKLKKDLKNESNCNVSIHFSDKKTMDIYKGIIMNTLHCSKSQYEFSHFCCSGQGMMFKNSLINKGYIDTKFDFLYHQ